ncbi:MAG TPA: hypothetical protein VFL88_01525 [Gemmatimonadales bacterium]|jgi:hypothetical protein|nr:hypothetical protein [Gemmatimonadales bacterium]
MTEIPNEGPTPVAIAATQGPVELRAELVEDDRTPEGMVCMGTFRGERLVSRCVLPPEAWNQIEEFGLLDEPVQVVLLAREAPPGLQCQLFAVVEVPDDLQDEEEEDEEPEEPWAASVPSSGYEAAVEAEDDDAEANVATLPLGNIVRYAHDRVHPESLSHEAADVLRKVIQGETAEMVDRALADLFKDL